MATFPKSARIRGTLEFRNTFEQGLKVVCNSMVLYAAIRNSASLTEVSCTKHSGVRLGLIASRKAGHAVLRNRFKRCIRESFRRLKGSLDDSSLWVEIDLVVLARPSSSSSPSLMLTKDFLSCIKRMEKLLQRKRVVEDEGAKRHGV